MKSTMILRSTFVGLALLHLVFANAAIGERSKSYEKRYAVGDPNFYMEIDNQYGDVQIIPWNKDSILVQTQATVRSNKDEQMQELLDQINVEFNKTRTFLLVTTGWDQDVSFFKKTTYNLKQGFDAQDKIVIDQTVYVPADLTLEIRNRFGHVFMSDYAGELTVRVNHGDFRARKLDQLESLEASFGRVKIKELNSARLDFSSVKSATIGRARKLTVTASSSEISFEEVGQLNLTSRHDDIQIEKVKTLQGTAVLSDIVVNLVTKELDLASKLGSVHIEESGAAAREIRVQGNKTDISIGLTQTFLGDFRVDVDSKCRVTYSGRIEVKSKGVDDDGRRYLTGTMGREALTRVIVKADGGYLEMGD